MKHSIRRRVEIPKIEADTFQLGSGVFDKHGNEIFEGDLVTDGRNSFVIKFRRGSLCFGGQQLRNFDDGELEIVEQPS